MDYHSMNRRELQALCKQYEIPANSSNSVMADKLSQLLNDKKKPTTRRQRTCLKSSSETVEETDVTTRQVKKVRFSPKNEEFEYELRSGQERKANVTETKTRRKSVAKKSDEPDADNVDIVKSINEGGEISVRATRSSGKAPGNGVLVPINRKKQGRKAMKDVKRESEIVKGVEVVPVRVTRSKVQTLGKSVVLVDENNRRRKTGKDAENDSKAVKEIEDSRISVTRSKVMDPNLNLQVKKGSRSVAKDVVHVEPSKRIVDDPIRVTRARAQTLNNDLNTVAHPAAEKRRAGKEMKAAGRSNESSVIPRDAAPGGIQGLPKRKSLRNREVVIDDENGSENLKPGGCKRGSNRSIDEVSENEKHADKGWRRSSRNEKNVEDSTVLNKNVRKVEVVSDVKVTRSRAQFLMKSAEGNNKTKNRNEVEGQRDSDVVRQVLEHVDRRNGNRRKSAMPKPEDSEVVLQLEEPTNRPAQRGRPQNSVMLKAEEQGLDKPMVGKGKMLKESEMVELARVPSRRSQRPSNLLQPIAPTVDNARSDKTIGRKRSKEHSGDHRSKKLRGESIVEEPSETKYAASVESPRRFTRGASRKEGKAVRNSPQKFSGEVQQPSSLKTQNFMTGNQSAPENASVRGQQSGTGRALRSGVIRGSSSTKRAKLRTSPCGTERSGSKNGRSGKSNIKGAKGRLLVSSVETPASRFRSSEADERVAETEYSPVVKGTPRRFTRSAIKSERNAVGTLFEKVDQKQQRSLSTVKGKPTEDAELSSHEVADDRPDVDSSSVIKHSSSKKRKKSTSTAEIHSKTSDEAKGEILVKSVAISEANHVVEVNEISVSETAVVKENMNSGGQSASLVEFTEVSDGSCATASAPMKSGSRMPRGEGMEIKSDSVGKSSRRFIRGAAKCERTVAPNLPENVVNENQGNVVNLPNYEVDIPSGVEKSEIEGTPASVAGAPETETDELLDRSHLKKQNEEVSVKSAIPNEAEVPVNTEATPVFKPMEPEAYGKGIGMETSGSTQLGLHMNEGDKEPDVSTGKTGAPAGNGNEGIPKANNMDENWGSVMNLPNYEVDIPSGVDRSEIEGTPASVADPPETATDEILDRSYLKKQNEEVSVKSAIPNEAEVPVAVNTEATPVFKPGEPEAYGKDIGMETSGSAQVGLHVNEGDKEPEVSTSVTGAAAEHGSEGVAEANDMDAGSKFDAVLYRTDSSADGHASIEQSNLMTKLHAMESPCELPSSEKVHDAPALVVESKQEQSTSKGILQNPSVGEHDVVDDGQRVVEDDRTDTRKMMGEPDVNNDRINADAVILPCSELGENDVADVVDHQELDSEQPSSNKDTSQDPALGEHSVELNVVKTEKELVSQLDPSTGNDIFQGPAVFESNFTTDEVNAQKIEVDKVSTGEAILSGPALEAHDFVHNVVDVEKDMKPKQEPSTTKDKLPDHSVGGPEPEPLFSNDICQRAALCKNFVEVESVEAQKGGESEVEQSTAQDCRYSSAMDEYVGDYAQQEAEHEPLPSTASKELEVPVIDKIDVVEKLDCESMPSTGATVLESVFGCDDVDNKDADAGKELRTESKPPTDSDMLATTTLEKLGVQDEDIVAHNEFEQVPSTVNDVPTLSKNDVEVESVDIQKGGESEVEQSTAKGSPRSSGIGKYDVDYAQKEVECEPVTPTCSKKPEVPVMDKIDVFNTNDELDCDSLPSTRANVLEPVFGSDDVDGEDADANKELESKCKPPTNSEMLETPTLEKLDVEDGCIAAHSESEQLPPTGNDGPAMIDDSEDRVNTQNEYNMPAVSEYPNKLSDQEPEAVLHVSNGEVPKGTTDGCASISQSGPLPGIQVLETSAEGGNDVSSEGLDTHEESIQSSKKDSLSQNSDHGKREELVNKVCDGPVSGRTTGSDDLLPIYNPDEIEVLVDTKNDIGFCENDAASNYGIASATESGTVRGEKSIDESEEFFNLSEDSSIKALFETQWVHEPLGVADFQESQETKEGRLGLVDDPGKERTSLVADEIGRNMGEFVDRYVDNKDEPDSNLVSKDDQIKKNEQESLLTEVGGGPSQTISNLGDLDTDRGTVKKEEEPSGPERSTDDEPSNPEPVKNRTQDAKEASSSRDDSEEDDKDDCSQEDDQPSRSPDVKMVDAPSGKETQTVITPGCRTLYMGNLSYAIYEEDVRDFFKPVGEIAEIRFAIKDDMFRGYGYIKFTTAEAAQEALKLNRKLLLERPIRLELANERSGYNPGSDGEQAQRRSVFIWGFDVNDGVDNIQGSLIECFKNCGEISRCHVPTDFHSGAPRGVAFIDFADGNAFNRALELNGSELGGNKITVKEARGPRRDNNRGSWQGGGHGFDGSRGGGRGDFGGSSRRGF